MVNLLIAPPVPFLPESAHGKPIVAVIGCWTGDLEAGEAATAPFRSLGTVIADVFAANPYAGWQQALDPLWPRGVHNYFRSAFIRTADDASLRVLLDSYATLPTPMTEIHLQHLGGGSPDVFVGHFRPGSSSSSPPRVSMAMAMRASGEW